MDSCCLIVASICHVHSLFVCFSEIKNQVIVDLRLTDIMLIADTQRILNSCSTLDYPGGVLPIKVLYKMKHDLTLHCKQWRDKKNNVVFFNNMNISPKWAALGVPRSTCGRALLAKRGVQAACQGIVPRTTACSPCVAQATMFPGSIHFLQYQTWCIQERPSCFFCTWVSYTYSSFNNPPPPILSPNKASVFCVALCHVVNKWTMDTI